MFIFKDVRSAVAPILDIENESEGYVGTIGERNVLVDLKPHLQIKNIDAISKCNVNNYIQYRISNYNKIYLK